MSLLPSPLHHISEQQSTILAPSPPKFSCQAGVLTAEYIFMQHSGPPLCELHTPILDNVSPLSGWRWGPLFCWPFLRGYFLFEAVLRSLNVCRDPGRRMRV